MSSNCPRNYSGACQRRASWKLRSLTQKHARSIAVPISINRRAQGWRWQTTESYVVVILGDPGSGKSTLLQYLLLQWAEKATFRNKSNALGFSLADDLDVLHSLSCLSR